MARANAETERLVADQLVIDGVAPLRARVAAAALLAAVTVALFEWALTDDIDLADAIEQAIETLEGTGG
jgi:hypothetical protein